MEATLKTALVLLVAGVVLVLGLYTFVYTRTTPSGTPTSTLPPGSGKPGASLPPAQGGGNNAPPEPFWPPPSNRTGNLVLTTSTDYPNYSAGEPVGVYLRLANVGNATEIVYSAGCPAGFRVQDPGLVSVYDSLAHVRCSGVPTSRTLMPGGVIAYDFTWDQGNDSGAQIPDLAWYRILGYWNGTSSTPIALFPRSTFIGPPITDLRLAFSVTTDRETYVLGEVANVSVTLTNAGNDPAVLNFPTPCFAQFLALNETSEAVYNSSRLTGCIQILWGVTLAPGEGSTRTFRWNLSTDEGTPVPTPGSYRLVPSFGWWLPQFQSRVVRTDTATIAVNP